MFWGTRQVYHEAFALKLTRTNKTPKGMKAFGSHERFILLLLSEFFQHGD